MLQALEVAGDAIAYRDSDGALAWRVSESLERCQSGAASPSAQDATSPSAQDNASQVDEIDLRRF
jgi:hypothetical protein